METLETLEMQHMLDAYFNHALKMLDDVEIYPEHISNIDYASLVNCWGRAKRKPSRNIYDYNILISEELVKNAWGEEGQNIQYTFQNVPLMQTILHECLHCVEGCWSHGTKWKQLADIVNRTYGFHITRTTSAEEVNVDYSKVKIYKYVFKCERCGNELAYTKRSKFVQHPEWYVCSCCKKNGIRSHFIRIK